MRKIIKLQNNWCRDKPQEDTQVFRWFRNDDRSIIASVVEGYFPNEANLRVSGKDFYFETRGHKSIMLKKSDNEWIEDIERLIKREDTRK